MRKALVDILATLRATELEEGDTHPADLPRDDLVEALVTADGQGDKSRRAKGLAAEVEARARLSFAPGAGEVIGIQSTHRKRGPIEIGDRVRMSGTFLRNTGQYFKTLETEDKGTVESISSSPYDDWRLATVRWDRYALPGGEKYLLECPCVGDERPTCKLCRGSGKWLGRVNVKNLEVVRARVRAELTPF